jgi:general secretion pathway protein F
MVAVGEKSGSLEEMLGNVADAYEDQVETTVTALTSLLEPIMIIGMGVVVAFIVFSILMPILQINSIAGG